MLKVTISEAENESVSRELEKRLRSLSDIRADLVEIARDTGRRSKSPGKSEILIVSGTGARGGLPKKEHSCRILLCPGTTVPGKVDAELVVSYGMSAKDSITASSIDEEECVIALQRELVTTDGAVLDRQEIPVRKLPNMTAEEIMAVTGGLLLLGVPPEDLIAR